MSSSGDDEACHVDNLNRIAIALVPRTQETEMSTEFYAEEIRRALEEQDFGVKSFTLLESDTSGVQARATVILLEGQKIMVKLNSEGYSVRDGCPYTKSRRKADFLFRD